MKWQMVTPYLCNEVFIYVCLFQDFFLQRRFFYKKLKKIQDECILSQWGNEAEWCLGDICAIPHVLTSTDNLDAIYLVV